MRTIFLLRSWVSHPLSSLTLLVAIGIATCFCRSLQASSKFKSSSMSSELNDRSDVLLDCPSLLLESKLKSDCPFAASPAFLRIKKSFKFKNSQY